MPTSSLFRHDGPYSTVAAVLLRVTSAATGNFAESDHAVAGSANPKPAFVIFPQGTDSQITLADIDLAELSSIEADQPRAPVPSQR